MKTIAYTHVALTAFLEPFSQGDLWVWMVKKQDFIEACKKLNPEENRALFDLISKDHPEFNHEGRFHAELLLSKAMASRGYKVFPASMLYPRMSLKCESNVSEDCQRGFLDLLVNSDILIQKGVDDEEFIKIIKESLLKMWGISAHFCGWVADSQWDDYRQRASAIKSLIDLSEINRATHDSEKKQTAVRL